MTAKTHRYNNNARNTTIQIVRQLVEPPSSQVLVVLLYPSSNHTCKHKLQVNKQENKRPNNIPTQVLILFLLIRVLVKVVDEGVGEAIVVGRRSPYYHDHNQDEAEQEVPEAIFEPHPLPILCRVALFFAVCFLAYMYTDTSLMRTPH